MNLIYLWWLTLGALIGFLAEWIWDWIWFRGRRQALTTEIETRVPGRASPMTSKETSRGGIDFTRTTSGSVEVAASVRAGAGVALPSVAADEEAVLRKKRRSFTRSSSGSWIIAPGTRELPLSRSLHWYAKVT